MAGDISKPDLTKLYITIEERNYRTRSVILFEKLTVAHVVKKSPDFHGHKFQFRAAKSLQLDSTLR